jgi:hypothetical protein
MGGPPFSTRRPNAAGLSSFELPPPPMTSKGSYHYAVSGSQTPGSLASVGNLLTPPSTIGGQDVSPSPTGSVHPASSAPSYANSGAYSWTQATQSQPTYYHTAQNASHSHSFQQQQQQQQQQRVPYSPSSVRGHPHSPQSDGGPSIQQQYELPQYSSSGSMTAVTISTHAPQPQSHAHHQLQSNVVGSSTQVPSSGPHTHPSPVHNQEAFRPPPTPGYYSQQSTPQHSPFPFTTGPSQPQMTLASTGPMMHRSHLSPATSGPSQQLRSPALHSPHNVQGQQFRYGPVMSSIHNPNSQPILVGTMSHGLVHGFNSGHAAAMAMYGNPNPQTPPQNDRPFKCDQCPQSFNRNHDLKRHKRIHLAVKPFPCGHCEKSFSRKDALKVNTV